MIAQVRHDAAGILERRHRIAALRCAAFVVAEHVGDEAEAVELDRSAQRRELGGVARILHRIGGAVLEEVELRRDVFDRGGDRLGTGEHRLLAGRRDRFARHFIEAGERRAGRDRPGHQCGLAVIEPAPVGVVGILGAPAVHIEPGAEHECGDDPDAEQG